MSRLKTAILISGRGSNMRALIEECSKPEAPAEIVLVIANNPNAAGLKFAREKSVPTHVIDHRNFKHREDFENEINSLLEANQVDFVCLAGFMRILTKNFVGRWNERIMNIHPSLLPAYPGLNTHQRALEDGVKFVGCTVHFVREEVDVGPIIIQAVVPVGPKDTIETLAARVLAKEHKCICYALTQIAVGNVKISAGRVVINASAAPASGAT
ncbi:MAG: phosphoribosylglycinamide formyltransferase, partial [Pseudomonadota bacterium]|nr:phosphoribosylglycinamide formyltransferase [Pseudomonadota bacterium]